MKNSKVEAVLVENERYGEQAIASIQAFMAWMALAFHCVSASNNDWKTFSTTTVLIIFLLIMNAIIRLRLARKKEFPKNTLHFLTIADGLLIFGLLLSYNAAYGLELAATFKAPSLVLLIVYTGVHLFRFNPTSILVAGGTVLGGYTTIFLAALFGGGVVTNSYKEYLFSQKLMIGATLETALSYLIFLFILGAVTAAARRFVAKTSMVEELEAANRKAEESTEEFEKLFSSTTEGILIVDADGIIEKSNPALERLFGYKAGELAGKSASILMSEMHAEALRYAIREYLAGGANHLVGVTYESEGISKTGESLEIELSINEFRTSSGATHFAGFIRDISARKSSQRNEYLAKAQFENAVNAAMDAIIIIDEDGRVVGFNPAAEETFGYKFDEVSGKKLSDTIIPERYRKAHDDGMTHYLATGKAPVLNSRIEIEGLHASGSELEIELAIREINSVSGKLFFGYARDIGERKTAERELIQAKNEAEIASKAKARFLAMMSHEIRTPLNGVLGIVNLLAESNLDMEQHKLLATARDSGQSLLAIINDILDFSKLEAGKLTIEKSHFELGNLVDSIINLIRPQASEKGLILNHKIQPLLDNALIGDADRIRQVLLNLVWNAVKFTDKGVIDLRVGRPLRGVFRFEVVDTGIGIGAEEIDQLFLDFSTLDEQRDARLSGTGLGLVICKSLVEAMDGSIHVESSKGHGSRFWFDLPLEESDIPLPLAKDTILQPDYEAQLAGKRILVAEDNVTNQLIIRNYLIKLGCRVDVANDGIEAVNMFTKGQYDLVLMDISMPRRNGFEATREIRRSSRPNSQLPIIAFTAYASEEDREKVLASDMDDHITKPFTREQLLGVMSRHLERSCNDVGNVAAKENESFVSQKDFDPRILASVFDPQNMETSLALLGQFASDLDQYKTTIADSLEKQDWSGVEYATHALKGSSGMFGAIKLCEIAEQVNTLCRDGEIENEQELAVSLIKETKLVLEWIAEADQNTLPDFIMTAAKEGHA